MKENLREAGVFNNPHLRKNVEVRSRVNLETRIYFHKLSYIEAETPILTPDPEIAPIRPFTIENPECYLRITDTEFLKRLVYGGFDKVFQLSKHFREGDSNYKSNPEFTQLSVVARGIGYEEAVGLFKDYMIHIAKNINDTPVVSFLGSEINLETDWVVITVKDALAEFCNINLDENIESSDLEKTLQRMKIPISAEAEKYAGVIKYNIMLEPVLDEFIMPHFKGKLLFLKEYPFGLGAPGKAVERNPQYKERGEVFVNGIEFLNGQTVPTDPDWVKNWYDHALKAQLESGLWPGKRLDEDYLSSVGLGVPHMASMSLGYDRFLMMLTDSKDISEVITFPVTLNTRPKAI